MSFRVLVFSLGCAGTWFILLPIFVIGGGIALFIYAVLSELSDSFGRDSDKAPDGSTAREIARQMCLGQ
jgi:hypothetical protein